MNRKKIKLIIDNASERIFLINHGGEIIIANQAANNFFGNNEEHHTIFHRIEATYHADVQAFLKSRNTKSIVRKKALCLSQNGSMLPVSLVLQRIFIGQQLVFLVIITDLFYKKITVPFTDYTKAFISGKQNIISFYDHQFNCIYAGAAGIRQLGYSQNEFQTKSFFDLLHENDRRRAINEFYEYISGKSIFNSYIYRFSQKSGTPIWITGTVKIVISEYGYIAGFIINHHINFIQIKSILQQPFFAKSEEMLVLLNSDFHLEFISPACQHLLGYNLDEISATNIIRLSHPNDHTLLNALLQNQKASEDIPVLHIRHKNGDYIAFEGKVTKFYNAEKQISNIVLQLRKLPEITTAQVSSETANDGNLSDHDHLLYRNIFEQLKDAVLLIDTESRRIINCNFHALQLFEASDKSELVGMEMQEFHQRYVQTADAVKKGDILKNGNRFDREFHSLSGEVFWGNVSVTEIMYGQSPVSFMQITDITQIKQRERELLQANETSEQIIKAQERFLSTVSHEIRTPLNAVLGMTHLLMQGQPRQDQVKLLETLKFSGDNLIALIDEILDYSKVEAGKLELETSDFNLKKFIQSIKLTYKNLANNKGLIFRLLSEEEMPEYVKGDVTRLGQILNNLLNNAVKFTDKGQIVLSIYVEQETKDTFDLLFEVSDTGIGIPEDKLEVIFDPFRQASTSTTRHFGGTGLGLAIVKNLVELYGGKLTINSVIGEGTVFRVTIPFKKADIQFPLSNGTSDFIAEYQSLEGLKVLYVEDVLPNQFLMEGLADNWNIQLDTALNGLEALEKVRQNKYDLILMDIQMPEMDGFETTQEIRNLKDPHYVNIPIVALSASVSETTRERIRITGMNDYISKPINPEDLHRKLSKFSSIITGNKTTLKEQSEPEGKNGIIAASADSPDFSTLQNVYVNDQDNYLKILYQIRDLINDTVPILMQAVKTENEEDYRSACHKISSYVKLFKLNNLDKTLLAMRKILMSETKEIPKDLVRQAELDLTKFITGIEQEIEKAKV